MGSGVHLAEAVGWNVNVDVFTLVNQDRMRSAGPAHIEHGDERAQTPALFDQYLLPPRMLRTRRCMCLCGGPVLFDQREDWIDARGRQGGHRSPGGRSG